MRRGRLPYKTLTVADIFCGILPPNYSAEVVFSSHLVVPDNFTILIYPKGRISGTAHGAQSRSIFRLFAGQKINGKKHETVKRANLACLNRAA